MDALQVIARIHTELPEKCGVPRQSGLVPQLRVRIVFEPKTRNIDPVVMMESLFRVTELETRIPMNMNVLSGGLVPKVLGLPEALREWLDHRREVLLRRSRNRLGQIEKRLEILTSGRTL